MEANFKIGGIMEFCYAGANGDICCPYCTTFFDVDITYEECKCCIGSQEVKCPECNKIFMLRVNHVSFEAEEIKEKVMKEYRVTWVIDVSAESPEDAARKALEIQRDVESTALVFKIREIGISKLAGMTVVDLQL